MLYNFECTGENFSLRKAVLEIKEDLKSEAIWYIFGPFTKYGKHGPKGSFEAFYRTHFFCLNLWKLQKFSFTLFSQKFREINGFSNKITK